MSCFLLESSNLSCFYLFAWQNVKAKTRNISAPHHILRVMFSTSIGRVSAFLPVGVNCRKHESVRKVGEYAKGRKHEDIKGTVFRVFGRKGER